MVMLHGHHVPLRRVEHAELMEMVVEPAHRILDSDVQIPEGVLLGHPGCDVTSGFVSERTTRNWCPIFGRGVRVLTRRSVASSPGAAPDSSGA
jgi:hypothetical protein